MSTSHTRLTAQIKGSPQTLFDLIAGMQNYGRWLPGSEAWRHKRSLALSGASGTTYLDVEPAGERSGPVVVHVFRKENVRILEELKRYVEAQSRPRSLGTKGAPNALGNDMSHNSKEESNG